MATMMVMLLTHMHVGVWAESKASSDIGLLGALEKSFIHTAVETGKALAIEEGEQPSETFHLDSSP